jgi:hypothetical protein
MRKQKQQNTWIAWLALVVAFVGGVPGLINTADYFRRNSLKINFDSAQSVACGIQTDNPKVANKLAVVLYRINITGHGMHPMYLRELRIELKINNNWIVGSHIVPKLFTVTNILGTEVKAIHLRTVEPTATMTLVLEEWNEIGPNSRSLQYGEPLNGSYAAIFDVEQQQFQHCDQLRITATDYLGHEYESVLQTTPFMKRSYAHTFLVLDGE